MLSSSHSTLVAIQARDFERAVAFYKDVLGLEMTFRRESLWAEFRAPGLSLGIEAGGDDVVVGGGSVVICFEVSRIERLVEGLRRRGISFLGPVRETDHGKEACFLDSEGNPLLLHESSAPLPARTAKRAGDAALVSRPAPKPPRAARDAKGGGARKSKPAGSAKTSAKAPVKGPVKPSAKASAKAGRSGRTKRGSSPSRTAPASKRSSAKPPRRRRK